MDPERDIKNQHTEHAERLGDRHESETTSHMVGHGKTTIFMTFFSFYIALASWMYNFDLGFSGVVLLMPSYNNAFGICASTRNSAGEIVENCSLTALQQSLISLTFLFIALGSALAAPAGYYTGRKGTIQIGCILVAAGAGGMIGSTGNFTAYMAAKCVQGVGLGFLVSAAPVYGVESVTPNKRGVLMGLFNVGLALGNFVAVAVCYASSRYKSNLAWQTPIICQLPLAFLLGIGVCLFPESPRWLLVKGREEAAKKSFAKFYQQKHDSPEIARQVQEVLYYIEIEKNNRSESRWTEIFTGVDLRRTLTSLVVVVVMSFTGNKFMTQYSAIFLKGLGLSNPYAVTMLIAGMVCIGAVPSPWITEVLGRRLNLLVGYGGMGLCMMIVAAVGSGLGSQSSVSKITVVVFLCLWAVMYSGFVGTSLSTTAPEMHSIRLRTYGQAFTITVFEILSFGASFATPYMLSKDYGNMATNVGYFYFGLTAIGWVFIFVLVPETGRLTLEQIDELFLSGEKAWRTSLSRNKKVAERPSAFTTKLDTEID